MSTQKYPRRPNCTRVPGTAVFRPGSARDRVTHECTLGAAVSGVHQERPVRDHLEVLSRPPQHELAARGLAVVDDDRAVAFLHHPSGRLSLGESIGRGPWLPIAAADEEHRDR